MSEHGPIEAVILAGGLGTRLKPYTELIPKPLVPIHGIPVIEIVLRQLARYNIRNVAITLGYQSDLIRAHIDDGERLGLNVCYNTETTPLGTAGPLAELDNFADNFLVLNGDLVTTLDFRNLLDDHRGSDALLTIAAHERYIPVEFGVIEGTDCQVTNYVEKPTLRYRVSMGIYAFSKSALGYIPKGKRLDFPDLVLQLLEKEKVVRYFSFDDYWLDIGSGADFERALDEFPSMKKLLLGD